MELGQVPERWKDTWDKVKASQRTEGRQEGSRVGDKGDRAVPGTVTGCDRAVMGLGQGVDVAVTRAVMV